MMSLLGDYQRCETYVADLARWTSNPFLDEANRDIVASLMGVSIETLEWLASGRLHHVKETQVGRHLLVLHKVARIAIDAGLSVDLLINFLNEPIDSENTESASLLHLTRNTGDVSHFFESLVPYLVRKFYERT